jgi:hypothetical protein
MTSCGCSRCPVEPVGQVVVIGVGDVEKPPSAAQRTVFIEVRPVYQPSGRSPVTSVCRRIASRCRRARPRACRGSRSISGRGWRSPSRPPASPRPGRGCAPAPWRRRRRDRHGALGEHAMQPPEAGAGAVFVDRLHVPVALARPGRGADDLRQEGLGLRRRRGGCCSRRPPRS